jgi:hypothetical protein
LSLSSRLILMPSRFCRVCVGWDGGVWSRATSSSRAYPGHITRCECALSAALYRVLQPPLDTRVSVLSRGMHGTQAIRSQLTAAWHHIDNVDRHHEFDARHNRSLKGGRSWRISRHATSVGLAMISTNGMWVACMAACRLRRNPRGSSFPTLPAPPCAPWIPPTSNTGLYWGSRSADTLIRPHLESNPTPSPVTSSPCLRWRNRRSPAFPVST